MSEDLKTITAEDVAALVEYIARSLVDDPDSVKVVIRENDCREANASEDASAAEIDTDEEAEGSADEAQVTIELSVAKDDMGKVIGKQGRIAKAIRTVVRAATVRSDVRYRIDIL